MRVTRKNTIDDDEIGVDPNKVKKSTKLIAGSSDLKSEELKNVSTKGIFRIAKLVLLVIVFFTLLGTPKHFLKLFQL